MSLKSLLAASSALVLGAGASFAGGAVSPVIEVAPITIEEAPVVGAWEGAYAGGSLNYTFGAEDEVGLSLLDDGQEVGRGTDLGDVKLEGASLGLHAGYRWQRDQWVFGPELTIEGGNVDNSINIDGGDAGNVNIESELNYLVTLVMKTGYEVQPGTLIYGTFGIASGDFDYTLSTDDVSVSDGFSASGIAAGFGVEKKFNEKMSMFAGYQYRDLSKETATFTDGTDSVVSKPTTAHSNIRIGVNYSF
ncbi:outer membrane protein [Paracoccus sp. JM45]|uniref:outer membrane protein n=1 Tax=Paracoccus sp. JM45 TaxID=2283626 RepID=UPI0016043989|nr:outer membrane beta-barrel protein [Paracoccus sp. JM45]